MKKNTLIIITFFINSIGFCQQIGDGYASVITNYTNQLKSGIYNGENALGMPPDPSYPWNHLFVIRHPNTNNNYQLQISSSFTNNDRLFFRKLEVTDATSSNPTWFEIATRGTNTFDGNQTINGNVGIGTTNQNSRLDLGSGYGVKGAKFLIYNDNPDSELSGTKMGFYIDNFASNNLNLVFPESTLDPGLFTISAKNTSNTIIKPYFTIAGLTGNIGIGKMNPTNKLDVNGTIHSKEVKVDMTGWSDFVFNKEYNLPTLAEVEKHIKEKGHLENIPNEKEVLEKGISLGEMNAKLLQKIEELTLYMIDQNKGIQRLVEENKKQNEEIKTLKEKITLK